MNNQKIKLYIALGVIALVGAITVITFIYSTSKKIAPTKYSKSVQNAINKPIQSVGSWNVLVSTDTYEIAYSRVEDVDTFYITIIGKPVLSASQQAEETFLNKLGVSKEYACTLPVSIQVQRAIDESLWGYNFGFSFCPNKTHIMDISTSTPTAEKFYIKTQNGGTMQVNNFYKTAVKKESDRVVLVNNVNYQIYYYPDQDSFFVETQAVTENDFKTNAKPAASDIKKALGINDSQICQLPISVRSSTNQKLEPVSLAWLLGCK